MKPYQENILESLKDDLSRLESNLRDAEIWRDEVLIKIKILESEINEAKEHVAECEALFSKEASA